MREPAGAAAGVAGGVVDAGGSAGDDGAVDDVSQLVAEPSAVERAGSITVISWVHCKTAHDHHDETLLQTGEPLLDACCCCCCCCC